MKRRLTSVFALLLGLGSAAANEPYKVPPEITPAIRAACESEVRALCFTLRPTEASVVRCVRKKFDQLGTACQSKLVAAGLI